MSSPPVNALGHKLRSELITSLDRALEVDKARAVVVCGDGLMFSAGADIAEFARNKHRTSPSLGELLARMDDLNVPIVAGIHGNALGGGLELAMTCHWRLADAYSAKMGLPEVHLGLLPGAGGTQRLPRLVGVEQALKLMTSGRVMKAAEALQLGLVDALLEQPPASKKNIDMVDLMVDFALSERVLNTPVSERRVSSMPIRDKLSDNDLVRLHNEIKQSARGQVAPVSILKAVQAASEMPSFAKGLEAEARLFQELATGPQAKALQYFFFSERKSAAVAPKASSDANSIKQVGVVGGGTMGCGIAMTFANAGIRTTLVEASTEKANEAISKIEATYKASSAFKQGKQTAQDLSKIMALIQPSGSMSSLKDADLVVEAIFENMEIKKTVFAQLDKVCKQDAILATNTSYLDIDAIAQATSRPHKVIGTHFFSPAHVMKLLEVIHGKESSKDLIAQTLALGKRVGKVAVLAGNCYGFIGNRMLRPYIAEAEFLVEEGASPKQVDAALKKHVGMAMGPFELLDLAGNDVNWRQRKEQGLATCTSGDRYCSLADQLCESGSFGQKTPRGGWYSYLPSAPRVPVESETTTRLIEAHRQKMGIVAREISDEEIVTRCLFPLVNQGFRCLEEGIAQTAEDIDVIYVYGYGFPKFRGGPMFWAEKEQKLSKVVTALKELSTRFPTSPHFKASKLLEEVVSSGSTLREEIFFRKQKHQ